MIGGWGNRIEMMVGLGGGGGVEVGWKTGSEELGDQRIGRIISGY